MKKILISLDDETIQRIQDIKDADFSAMGLKLSTSAAIRLCVWREWRKVAHNCRAKAEEY